MKSPRRSLDSVIYPVNIWIRSTGCHLKIIGMLDAAMASSLETIVTLISRLSHLSKPDNDMFLYLHNISPLIT